MRMSGNGKNAWIAWVLFAALLLLPSLACSQAGEILTSEEATARARQVAEPTTTKPAAVQAELKNGDKVEFVGEGFLIPLYKNIGDRSAFSHAGRNETGTVLGSQEADGEMWYLVDGPSGEGWVPAESLQVIDDEASTGPQVGDKVYLTGKGYLISIAPEPGSMKMIAGQERGVEVTIIDVADVEGETWYKIDAPTGEGWIPAENITTEKP
ncbi:MAG: hypothetical protein B6I34_07515 [Anaerolineaceae bacterium 4572_32.1]|nr:MAG: hypothetical protein B6I34_07515 [Anaerolineaceae bacterium 4572_32.1]